MSIVLEEQFLVLTKVRKGEIIAAGVDLEVSLSYIRSLTGYNARVASGIRFTYL